MDRNTFFTALVIIVIGCLVGFNFVYLPKMEILRSLEEMQREERGKELLSGDIDHLKGKLSEYEKRLFTRGREEIELLNRVRDIASQVGVQVTSMIPQESRERRKKKKKGAGYRKFSLAISFEGTYHQLGDFIAMIENADQVMRIETLEFSAVQKVSRYPLRCQVTLSVFSML